MATGKLAGRVAFITGSDSGIGAATAIEMAEQGADVVVHYRSDKEGADQTRAEVEKRGRKALVVQGDVGYEEDVDRMFDEVLQEFDHIDILMNNAGTNGANKPVSELSYDEWDTVIKADLYSPFLCSRRFINEHASRSASACGRGKIINITSVHEEIPMAGAAGYNAAKGGVQNLTRTLAFELADKNISVSAIGPGMIMTPMNQSAVDNVDERRQKEERIPMKRAGEPAEVAKMAAFLASSDADYVTGSSFYMDGGLMQNVGQGA